MAAPPTICDFGKQFQYTPPDGSIFILPILKNSSKTWHQMAEQSILDHSSEIYHQMAGQSILEIQFQNLPPDGRTIDLRNQLRNVPLDGRTIDSKKYLVPEFTTRWRYNRFRKNSSETRYQMASTTTIWKVVAEFPDRWQDELRN